MQQLSSTDAAWKQIEPQIDHALGELRRIERDAVLLRYVEGESLREVGARLGMSEEAAKKRVGRAIEKLRTILAHRGISLSAALLASAMVAGVNATAVPAPILASLLASTTAGGAVGTAGALAAQAIAALHWARLKLATALAAAAVLVVTFVGIVIQHERSKSPASTPHQRAQTDNGAAREHQQALQNNSALPSGAAQESAQQKLGLKILKLRAVDAASAEGISNAMVAFTVWIDEKLENHFDLVTDESGHCDIPYATRAVRLDASVLIAGWAARGATWPAEGVPGIASEYTLRLERTTNTIGGQIVEPGGHPLADAEIWFSGGPVGDSAQRERPREHFGSFTSAPAARTDSDGRWIIRFVPPRHSGFHVSAAHPQFAKTPVISSPAQESLEEIVTEDIKQLWAGQLVTTMQSASTLAGTVLDENGQPIAGAKLEVRTLTDIFRTDQAGVFRVTRLLPGAWQFTVSADGFAPLPTNAQVGPKPLPMVLTLQTGAVLHLHVVDEQGHQVSDATVGLEQFGEHRGRLNWREKTDWDGRLEWRSAPRDVDLDFYVYKAGFCYARDLKFKADGEEHLVRLKHSLDVYGRVVDAETGYAIRDFKAVPGYGFTYSDMANRWFTGETVRGSNGLFKVTLVEKPPWQVRLVADGYEDWISPDLTNEFSVMLDVALKRGALEESVRGIVLNPDGAPATSAQVALLSLDHNVRLLRKPAFEGNKRWLTTTDQKGEFRFPVNRSAHSVAAVSVDGYAHTRVRDPGQPLQLQLQRWGRVEGVVDASARTHPIESIELYDPAADNYQGRVSLLGTYSTKVDAEGRFTFDTVPPGEFSVFINSLRGLSYHHKTALTVTAGQTTQVTIVENPGVLLKGRLIMSEARMIDWNKEKTIFRVERESLRFAPGWRSEDDKKLEAVDYWTSPLAREFVNSRHMTDLRISDDGTFISVERVVAGDYELFAIFKSAQTHRKISISEEQVLLPEFDLGAIELK